MVCLTLSQNVQMQEKFASNMIRAHLEEHIFLNKEKSWLSWSLRKGSQMPQKAGSFGDQEWNLIPQSPLEGKQLRTSPFMALSLSFPILQRGL